MLQAIKCLAHAATIAACVLLGLSGAASAATIDASTPIPDSRILLNFNNSGLDWVYAGPVGPGVFGSGEVEFPSFRAAEGWRTATADEWLGHPAWDDFIVPGNSVSPDWIPGVPFTNFSIYRAAPEYWSTFVHVDIHDFAAGLVTDGVNAPTGTRETIYVRNSVNTPEPATLALLTSALALTLATRRRNRRPHA